MQEESVPFEEAIKKGKEFVPYGSGPVRQGQTGYTFKHGEFGTGYYLCTRKTLLTQLRSAERVLSEYQRVLRAIADGRAVVRAGVVLEVERAWGTSGAQAVKRIEDMILSNDQEKQLRLQQLDRALAASSE